MADADAPPFTVARSFAQAPLWVLADGAITSQHSSWDSGRHKTTSSFRPDSFVAPSSTVSLEAMSTDIVNSVAGPNANRARPTALRGSCDVCTASKIGCSKEKPSCARCEKRGLECSYSPAKRVGRPMLNRKKQQTGHHDESRQNKFRAPATPMECSSNNNNNVASIMNTHTTANNSPRTSTASSATGQLSPVAFPEYGTGFMMSNDMQIDSVPLGTTLSSAELDQLLKLCGSETAFDPATLGGDQFHSMDDLTGAPFCNDITGRTNDMDFQATFDPESRTLPTPTTSAHSPQDTRGSGSVHSPPPGEIDPLNTAALTDIHSVLQDFDVSTSCSCLVRALGFLAEFSPEQIRRRRSQVGPLSLDRVLKRNHKAIDAVQSILQCECGTDAYLLVVLALIIFKVLAWFGAAATAGQPHADAGSVVVQLSMPEIDGWDTPEESPHRLAAQHVLSKLHRVLDLVNTLSGQLQDLQKGDKMEVDVTDSNGASNVVHGAGALENPLLTTALFKSLEKDLRNRYRTLARSVITVLRG